MDDDGNGFADDLLGWNFITNNGDPNPIPGNPILDHGTHCAGIADGVTNNGIGIASISWNLTVMPICVDANNTIPFACDGDHLCSRKRCGYYFQQLGSVGPYSNAAPGNSDYATGLGSIVLSCSDNDNELVNSLSC